MIPSLLLVLLAARLQVAVDAARETPPPELQGLEFLLGEWESPGVSPGSPAAGKATFARGLQGRVLTRTSYALYPSSSGGAVRHDDLMVIYVDPQHQVRADYYDNEGHVIRYLVSLPARGKALFVSDVVGGAPRYCLTYRLEAGHLLRGSFEIAPPGRPDAFSAYLTWESRRTAAPGK